MQEEVYILAAARLPIGKKGGLYKKTIPEAFTAYLLQKLIEQKQIQLSDIQQVILGCALGTGGNMARYTSLLAGLNCPSKTIDTQCSSGLAAVHEAYGWIQNNQHTLVVAGGMESSSLAPVRTYSVQDPRHRIPITDYKQAQFAPDSFGESNLLKAAANVANQFNISKVAMQKRMVQSHERAIIALNDLTLTNYILSYEGKQKDESTKENLSLERLQNTETPQLIDHTNASHWNDGAAIVVLASEKYVKSLNLKPKFKIVGATSAATMPNMAPMAALLAAEKLLNKHNLTKSDIDLWEVNESFAVNSLAFEQYFDLTPSSVNIWGGALAYGHPFGASGAVNLVHLMAALEAKSMKTGLVAVPAAGGLAEAMIIEKI